MLASHDEDASLRSARSQAPPHIAVLSGGSGGNSLVQPLARITDTVSYILPISDNGGSTSEILRVLGSVSVGDLRSRLVRLIPDTDRNGRPNPTKTLLAYRLPVDTHAARHDWLDLLDGRHTLWRDVHVDVQRSLTAYLRVFYSEILKRTAGLARVFNFSTAAFGNLVLSGMVLFFGHMETAIFTFCRLTHINEHTRVLPILSTRFTTPIAAVLQDGTVIAGQNAISHPAAYSAIESNLPSPEDDDANLPGSLASLRAPGIIFDKQVAVPLPSPIERIYYINPYGQEMHPQANPNVLQDLAQADALVYAPGSLYTSLAPLLLPAGIGKAIQQLQVQRRPRIFLLNGSLDRETPGYSCWDFLVAAAKAAGLTDGLDSATTESGLQALCSHLVYIRQGDSLEPGTSPEIDLAQLRALGIATVSCAGRWEGQVRVYQLGDRPSIILVAYLRPKARN
ncbi:hypothetical protein BCR37DRAFT_167959 [Protomyces lactucae-debilis]|uniref:Uncharacterized protein n=1 Tax=Protomyces lactucae-debilis TaxID=2754530 RepID=A0A1Y2EY89_PROLT|nr:uncharacterized protein BCR37DRAFT_167959 [Protomyces lactucae-debilis]ORY76066.1 hypothetical protein BCR37DRAFT_167959 [Protomyces lactucae-debilis]